MLERPVDGVTNGVHHRGKHALVQSDHARIMSICQGMDTCVQTDMDNENLGKAVLFHGFAVRHVGCLPQSLFSEEILIVVLAEEMLPVEGDLARILTSALETEKSIELKDNGGGFVIRLLVESVVPICESRADIDGFQLTIRYRSGEGFPPSGSGEGRVHVGIDGVIVIVVLRAHPSDKYL